MKILFCGGGTAGHVNPAVAIAKGLINKSSDNSVAFISRVGGEEYRSVIKNGYPLFKIKISGISNKRGIQRAKSMATALSAVHASKKILRDFSPDAVVGTGGYVCWPVLTAARLLKIPTLIHESNSIPGLTTRVTAKKCDRVLLNIAACADYLVRKDNIRIVGNPLLKSFSRENKSSARRSLGISSSDFFILSLGGSGGAAEINRASIELMRLYSTKKECVKHIHSTGNAYYNEAEKEHPDFCRGINGCKIVPYIDNMDTMLSAADLVICRAGATTLSEISATATAAILIPSPNVADNHQYKNAKYYAERGAALLITEEELEEISTLIATVRELYGDRKKRLSLAENAAKLSTPNAVNAIIKQIEEVATPALKNHARRHPFLPWNKS